MTHTNMELQNLPLPFDEQIPSKYGRYGPNLEQGSFQQLSDPYTRSAQQAAQLYQKHGISAAISPQMHVPNAAHGVEQIHMPLVARRVCHVGSVDNSPRGGLQTHPAYQQQRQLQLQHEQQKCLSNTFNGHIMCNPSEMYQTHTLGMSDRHSHALRNDFV